jgi:cell division protein FtsA
MSMLYQSQRAMRAKRQEAMRRGVVAILDIGTHKTSCLVLRFDQVEDAAPAEGIGAMAGQSNFRVIGAATTRSRGVRFGEIDSCQETERAIRTAVQAAQKMAQVRVDHVIVSFAGARPRSYGLAGEVPITQGTVQDPDGACGLRCARCGAGARGAARAAREFRARSPHGPERSARAWSATGSRSTCTC